MISETPTFQIIIRRLDSMDRARCQHRPMHSQVRHSSLQARRKVSSHLVRHPLAIRRPDLPALINRLDRLQIHSCHPTRIKAHSGHHHHEAVRRRAILLDRWEFLSPVSVWLQRPTLLVQKCRTHRPVPFNR